MIISIDPLDFGCRAAVVAGGRVRAFAAPWFDYNDQDHRIYGATAGWRDLEVYDLHPCAIRVAGRTFAFPGNGTGATRARLWSVYPHDTAWVASDGQTWESYAEGRWTGCTTAPTTGVGARVAYVRRDGTTIVSVRSDPLARAIHALLTPDAATRVDTVEQFSDVVDTLGLYHAIVKSGIGVAGRVLVDILAGRDDSQEIKEMVVLAAVKSAYGLTDITNSGTLTIVGRNRPATITVPPDSIVLSSIGTDVWQWYQTLRGTRIQVAYNRSHVWMAKNSAGARLTLQKLASGRYTYPTLDLVFQVGSHIVIHTPRTLAGGVGADPYLFPITGPILKLPNTSAMYRMYQHRDAQVFVDIHVHHRDILIPHSLTDDDSVPVRAGFYVTQISCHDLKNHTSWDLDTTTTDCFTDPGLPWADTDANTTVDVFGSIIDGTFRSRTLWTGTTARLEVRIYTNPQILNAFVLHVPPQAEGQIDGMVYRNYKPTQYVSSGKHLRRPFIHRKPGRPRTCSKTIVGPGEIPLSVTNPHLFGTVFR